MSEAQSKPMQFPGNGEFAPALLDPDIETPDGIIGPDGNTAPKRFSVYRNNVVVSLMEAVAESFPAVQAIIGEENFAVLSRSFIYHHPPNSAMMQNYGAEFPAYLTAFKPLAHAPYLADLANLEWQWIEAYHEENADCLAPDALTKIDQDALMQATFEAHPATRIVSSSFDLVTLFSVREGNQIDLEQINTASDILLTRPALQVHFQSVEQDIAIFLQNLLNGSTLGEALQSAMDKSSAFDPASAITTMMSSGAFSNITLQEQ